MNLKVKLYKPRSTTITMDTVELENLTSKRTTLTQRDRNNAVRNIPVAPKLHIVTLIDLAKESTGNKSLLPVAVYLAAHVTETNSTVKVEVRNICEDLAISDKTATKALVLLEEKGLIAREGRNMFDISPRLAYFGDPFEWSIALQYEKEGKEVVADVIKKIREQIEEADMKHNLGEGNAYTL